MSETRRVIVPEKYFNISMTVLLITGMYPLSSEQSFLIRLLFSSYAFFVYVFIIVLNPVSKAIALSYQTDLNEITDNMSLLINHVMACFKIAIFMIKRHDLVRLVEVIQSQKFRHQDCSENFSASRLIRNAVRTTQGAFCIFSSFVVGLIFNSILSATTERYEEILDLNGTESAVIQPRRYRVLPFHSWYPFSTQISPNYEIVFVYQIVALTWTSQMVMALDTLVVGFMIHIKVQFEILSHNIRFIKSHTRNRLMINNSSSCSESDLTKAIELELEKQIAHHRAIIKLSQELESVFTYQLLLQFICSLLATAVLLLQVSSMPVLSARFASMLSYLGATAFQLFIYCWFGNEMMLESLSVADAAWDSGWNDQTSSRRYCHGMVMIIHRSQRVIVITAGGFIDLTLNTFMTILRAAYSCFAVLKKMGGET